MFFSVRRHALSMRCSCHSTLRPLTRLLFLPTDLSSLTYVPQSNSFCHSAATDAVSTTRGCRLTYRVTTACDEMILQHTMRVFLLVYEWRRKWPLIGRCQDIAVAETSWLSEGFLSVCQCTYADRQLIQIRYTVNIAYSKQCQSE